MPGRNIQAFGRGEPEPEVKVRDRRQIHTGQEAIVFEHIEGRAPRAEQQLRGKGHQAFRDREEELPFLEYRERRRVLGDDLFDHTDGHRQWAQGKGLPRKADSRDSRKPNGRGTGKAFALEYQILIRFHPNWFERDKIYAYLH